MSEEDTTSNTENKTQPTSSVPDSKNEDVTALSDRDIKWRAKYKLTVNELETIKAKLDSDTKQLTDKFTGEISKVTEKNKLLEEKVIETKMEAEAIAAGLKDTEFLKLVDKKDIKINEDGSIAGVTEAIQAFKTRKPDLFGAEKKLSSSSNVVIPDSKSSPTTDAWNLTSDDWQKTKNSVGLR